MADVLLIQNYLFSITIYFLMTLLFLSVLFLFTQFSVLPPYMIFFFCQFSSIQIILLHTGKSGRPHFKSSQSFLMIMKDFFFQRFLYFSFIYKTHLF